MSAKEVVVQNKLKYAEVQTIDINVYALKSSSVRELEYLNCVFFRKTNTYANDKLQFLKKRQLFLVNIS